MASDNVMKKQEEEIDLLKLAKVLWKKIWVILICAVVLGIAGYYWTYRKMYTSYRSSALLYVNNNSVSLGSAKLSISSGDIKAVNNLMETYSVILNSRNTLTEIIDETGIPFTYEELKNMIKTETVGDTARRSLRSRSRRRIRSFRLILRTRSWKSFPERSVRSSRELLRRS